MKIRLSILTAIALLTVPLFAQAQALRPDLMYCGSPSRTGANLYSGVGPFNEVYSCTPTATTQAMLVQRSANLSGLGAAWLDYLNNGGIIITEHSISNRVYNEMYGTAYPLGTWSGSCQDNAMPSLKFNTQTPFWQLVQIPETPQNLEACGLSLNGIVDSEPEVTALGGWASSGLVNFASRPQGAGGLFLLDADWQDTNSGYTDDSREFMGALIGGATFNVDDVEEGKALFVVSKTFADGADGEIEVTLSCNGGLPLEQSYTLAGGENVTFTVTNIADAGVSCSVTESSGPADYEPVMNDGAGCSWTGANGAYYYCDIVNQPLPVDFSVTVDWEISKDADPGIGEGAYVMLECWGWQFLHEHQLRCGSRRSRALCPDRRRPTLHLQRVHGEYRQRGRSRQ